MGTRVFIDEIDRTWKVSKYASSFYVEGEKQEDESLYEIALSCAKKLGFKSLKSGTPLKYVNEHRRIWNLIWERGKQ